MPAAAHTARSPARRRAARLLATVRWDVVRQVRYGFYAVSVVVVLFTYGLLQLLPSDRLPPPAAVVPALLLFNLLVTTFYFGAAQVLLERAEGVLPALAVSPLRLGEYVTARVASLGALATAENLLVVALLYGLEGNLPLLLFGTLAMGALYTLFGFVAVARYDAINTFLMPSALYILLLILPAIAHFGLWPFWLFAPHPMMPCLVLLKAAYIPVTPALLAYGVLGTVCWLGLAGYATHRRLRHHLLGSAGGFP